MSGPQLDNLQQQALALAGVAQAARLVDQVSKTGSYPIEFLEPSIHSLFVFDPETLDIKFLSVGHFLRQHDPDFLSGDRISVFDNRNLKPSDGPEPLSSRILEIDAGDGSVRIALQGEGESSFFTSVLGVHEYLANGNILVTSSGEGRVIEFAPDGTIVWRYDNRLPSGRNARIYMAMLLPEYMDEAFFNQAQSSCGH